MLKKRDAQGLSIQIIIIAIIGLIVLVVVLAIFNTESGRSVKTLESCGARGGECKLPNNCEGGTKIPNICPDKNRICCVKIQ